MRNFAWKVISEMTYTVSGGTLNPTHLLTYLLTVATVSLLCFRCC